MKKLFYLLWFVIAIFIGLTQAKADDTDLFILRIPPNVLILLDMSGSMEWNVAGTKKSSVPYNEQRIKFARDALFELLNADDSNDEIDSNDEKTLGFQIGYMRFVNSYGNDDGNPLGGEIKVINRLPDKDQTNPSSYYSIWEEIQKGNPNGGTPLAAAIEEAKAYYLDYVDPYDLAVACRSKYMILITDGADTWGCDGPGYSEPETAAVRRARTLTVKKAKKLHDLGITVIVVGFGGDFPDKLKRTLNWAAYWGAGGPKGIDPNPLTNSGDPSAYNPDTWPNPCDPNLPLNADPANYPLGGYAFIAEDASQLTAALKTISRFIQDKSFSFTAPTIPSVRLIDKDVVYISSFIPNDTPFWSGNLKAYQLNENGTLPVDKDGYPSNSNLIWDAFATLKAIAPDSRKIYTFVNLVVAKNIRKE